MNGYRSCVPDESKKKKHSTQLSVRIKRTENLRIFVVVVFGSWFVRSFWCVSQREKKIDNMIIERHLFNHIIFIYCILDLVSTCFICGV